VSRFPQDFVDDLKAQADIVQVIQDSVPLKKAGTSYKGLCPFHTEKTPSFHVNSDKGFFHCFGCGTSGDVVKFVELQEKLSFPEAVRYLAHRFGLQIPESDDQERNSAAEVRREGLLKLHEIAAAYFQEQLDTPSGARARHALEQREIWSKTITHLGLGYAPPHREGLTQRLLDAGYTRDLLVASGLVIEREGGQIIDRFRNRLMIPICRDGGSVVAFGGRALENEQKPKYINSPETDLYTKGRTLYGLHLTKAEIRRLGYAVMVEGYFDFAQAFQAGVTSVVATCGTAVTNRQTLLLKRFTSKVILSFDPDAAGQGASTRSGELLVSDGFHVNVAILAEGEDPDTCVRRHGAAHYKNKLRTSTPYLEYVINRAAARRDFSRDEQRRAFLTEMLGVAAKIPEAAERDQFADRLAHKARVLEDVVRTEIRRAAVARRTDLATQNQVTTLRVTPAERGLIWATMRHTLAAQPVLATLDKKDLEGLATSSILEVARTLAEWPTDTVGTTLLERVSEDEAALVTRIASETEAPANVKDCALGLRRLRYERERSTLQHEIDRRQQLDTDAIAREETTVDDLLKQKYELLQRLAALEE
jgi:DNA primase